MASMNVPRTMPFHSRNRHHVTHQFRGTVPVLSPPGPHRIHDQAPESYVRASMLDSSSGPVTEEVVLHNLSSIQIPIHYRKTPCYEAKKRALQYTEQDSKAPPTPCINSVVST